MDTQTNKKTQHIQTIKHKSLYSAAAFKNSKITSGLTVLITQHEDLLLYFISTRLENYPQTMPKVKGKRTRAAARTPSPVPSTQSDNPREEEDHVSVFDEDTHEVPPTQDEAGASEHDQQGRKRKRKPPLVLDHLKEVAIVEWYRGNEMMYNKGLRDYRLTQVKSRMYDEQAKEVGITIADLKTWLDSMRSRFGRLTERKSGSGAKKLTERDEWILEAFAFLREHIVRVPGRQACNVCLQILHTNIVWKFNYGTRFVSSSSIKSLCKVLTYLYMYTYISL